VQFQLVLAAQGYQHAEIQDRTVTPFKAGPAPDIAPGIPREIFLQRHTEVIRRRQRAIDMGVAQHLAADLQALVPEVICHASTRIGLPASQASMSSTICS
jgi:hypothetical protein